MEPNDGLSNQEFHQATSYSLPYERGRLDDKPSDIIGFVQLSHRSDDEHIVYRPRVFERFDSAGWLFIRIQSIIERSNFHAANSSFGINAAELKASLISALDAVYQ